MPNSGSLNVKNISSELSAVSRWHQLGIKLGLQPSQLREIEHEFPTDIDRRKVEVVDLWLQNTPGASWRHIITALKEIGDPFTAEGIEMKYVKVKGMTTDLFSLTGDKQTGTRLSLCLCFVM